MNCHAKRIREYQIHLLCAALGRFLREGFGQWIRLWELKLVPREARVRSLINAPVRYRINRAENVRGAHPSNLIVFKSESSDARGHGTHQAVDDRRLMYAAVDGLVQAITILIHHVIHDDQQPTGCFIQEL